MEFGKNLLSHLLFTIIMEALSRVFKSEAPEGSFEGFVVGTKCGNTV